VNRIEEAKDPAKIDVLAIYRLRIEVLHAVDDEGEMIERVNLASRWKPMSFWSVAHPAPGGHGSERDGESAKVRELEGGRHGEEERDLEGIVGDESLP
jgi:hypothetical protein